MTMTGMDKLLKRREANRKSQQRSRSAKEALIKDLQEENDRLRAQQKRDDTPQTSTLTDLSTSPSIATTQPGIASIDLEACRQAFLAVLASVCDPHLNTIHAVCAKFAESRGRVPPGPDLQSPRPVNRPLNLDFDFDFGLLSPPSLFIPPHGTVTGPLSVPGLEPSHPIQDLEMDHQGIWIYVLSEVDLSRTDAEALATRLTASVRCYGFGPVLLKSDVARTCAEFPSISPTNWFPKST